MRENKENERTGALILFTAKNVSLNSVYKWLIYPYKSSEIPYNPNISDYNMGIKEKNQKQMQIGHIVKKQERAAGGTVQEMGTVLEKPNLASSIFFCFMLFFLLGF